MRGLGWLGYIALMLGCIEAPVAGADAPDELRADARPDLGPSDAALPDAALPDATLPDAALPDAAVPDAELPDAALPDAALPDAALPDAALPDAALPDAALPDAALPDAALPDATSPDAPLGHARRWDPYPAHPFRERLDRANNYYSVRALPAPDGAIATHSRGMTHFALPEGIASRVPAGAMRALHLSAGSTIAVTATDSGRAVVIYDLTLDEAATRVGLFATPDLVWYSAISSDGRVAYAANSRAVYVIDIGVPAAPVQVFDFEFERVTGIAASDDQLLVSQSDRLHVIDTRDPRAPVEWAHIMIEPHASGVAMSPDARTAYVTTLEGIVVVDLSNPAAPALIGRAAGPNRGVTTDITLSADAQTLFVTSGGAVTLYDVRDPAESRVRAAFEDSSSVRSADEVPGGTQMLVAGHPGVTRVDLRMPGRMASRPPAGLAQLECAWGSSLQATADGSTVFVAGRSSMAVDMVGGQVRAGALPGAHAGALTPDGQRWLAATQDALHIYDVRAPDAPALLGVHAHPDSAPGAIAVSPDARTAYLAAEEGGLSIIDISAPDAPVVLGSLYLRGAAHVRLSTDGETAFVSHPFNAFTAIDVRNPRQPQVLDVLQPRARAMALSPDGALVALAGDPGIWIVDVTDPAALQVRATFDELPSAQDIAFSADSARLFVADGPGLRVIDVADGTTTAVFETPGTPTGLVLSADGDAITLNADAAACLSRLPHAEPPTLTPLDVVDETARFRLRWSDRYPDAPEQIAWHASDGEVEVRDVDQATQTAVVVWSRAAEAEPGALQVAVGNFHYYEIARVRAD